MAIIFMVIVLDSRSSRLGSSPGGDIGLWSLGKTQVDSHSSSLHPGVEMGTSEYTCNAGDTSSPFSGLVSHPRESGNISSQLMLQKPG